jgi:hypothetical protein
MKQLSIRLITASLFFALLVTGCKKENSNSLSPAEEEEAARSSSESEARAEVVFNDIFDNVVGVNSDVGYGGTGVFGRGVNEGTAGRELDLDSLACLTVTKVFLNAPALFPVKITLDFGASCTDITHGHTRSGKVITVYTGRLIFPGSVATTTFENYVIDSIAVTGTFKITNSTATGSNQKQFAIDIIDGKLTKPNGDYHKITSHRVITQIEGNGTAIPGDDIFRVTGEAHGRIKHGNLLFGWISEITEPLIKKFSCPWISKGTVKVRRETLPATSPWVAVLNYGTGTCDFLATLTINGVPQVIQLPH